VSAPRDTSGAFPLRRSALSFLETLPRELLESLARGEPQARALSVDLFALELGPNFALAIRELERIEEPHKAPRRPTLT
jgi:hypothetical protein